jgi:hypothetical protein
MDTVLQAHWPEIMEHFDKSIRSSRFYTFATTIGKLPDIQRSVLSVLRGGCNIFGMKKKVVTDFSECIKRIFP